MRTSALLPLLVHTDHWPYIHSQPVIRPRLAGLSVLPLQVEAHSTRAMWLGKALDLRLEPLRKFDAMMAGKVAEGATVNEVVCKMLRAGGRPSPELMEAMRAQEPKATA